MLGVQLLSQGTRPLDSVGWAAADEARVTGRGWGNGRGDVGDNVLRA